MDRAVPEVLQGNSGEAWGILGEGMEAFVSHQVGSLMLVPSLTLRDQGILPLPLHSESSWAGILLVGEVSSWQVRDPVS
jgi:hypothetical protein